MKLLSCSSQTFRLRVFFTQLVWVGIFMFFTLPVKIYGQENSSDLGLRIAANYNQQFVLDGFVKVRELELEGDKLEFSDLGMNNFPSVELEIEKNFKNKSSINLTYENYFMSGSAVIYDEINYNGTIIDGSQGVDVSSTKYFVLSGNYKATLHSGVNFLLQLNAGLIYDHITFYVDGNVTPSSPRNEVYEHFGDQALPYPILGISTTYQIKKVNSIYFEISGTSIPKFKSFFEEGGNVYLRYSTILSELSFHRKANNWQFAAGGKFRSMHLFEESHEDTNDFKMVVAAPFVGVSFSF